MSSDTGTCVICGDDGATCAMDNMCSDCYWDTDAERKKARQTDHVWRFNRLCSFAMTCMNLDQAGAVAFALKEMKLDKPPAA